MASTYSDLKIELITTGEQSGTWGSTTNTNLGTALEEAIVGRATANFTTDADLTLTLTDTNATQVARHYILNVTSGVSLSTTRNLIVPTIDKPYIIENNTTGGQDIVVKTTSGSGVTVPNGKKAMVYANSTNVVRAFDSVGDLLFVGAAKISGDFSNATIANRVAFQSSTTNGNTSLTVLPNGTATGASVQVYNEATPTNAELFSLQITSTLATLASDIRGTGTYVPMALATGGAARVYIDTSGNVGIGTAAPSVALDVIGSIEARPADTQDAVVIAGRAGGTSSWSTTITPTTLSASRTVTIPDETFTIGFRNVPATGAKTAPYILALTDIGKYVEVGTGGSIEIPNSTFASGDVVSIFNNTSGNITITCTITTAYISGTDADKATVTLATRGIATILFISGTVCVITGNVS